MGFFGNFLFTDGRWVEVDPDVAPPAAPSEPWLTLDIHDSDLATVRFAPAGDATGEAYLGTTPRTYFDDPALSEPTNPAREASGLAVWAHAATGQRVDAAVVEHFLVADDDELSLDDELDDADIFVEVRSAQFVAALGLPVPDGLPDIEDHQR